LTIIGAEIEIDRSILDELADPLLHILRNCIDHGIESPVERAERNKPTQGRVSVNVRRNRDRVELEIQDDGRGMDPDQLRAAAIARGVISAEAARRLGDKEALMLCCLPGISTARDVSEISGRGVGMDAVSRAVENVGGTLEIQSELGKGTRFTLSLPLTVAVINLLLVRVGEEIFGLPIGKVLGAIEAENSKLSVTQHTAFLAQGTGMVPIQLLSSLLGLPQPHSTGQIQRPFVLMEGEAGRIALGVDQLLGQEEVVLKAVSRPLDMIPGLGGVTILGSGRPIFILDVPRLLAA
jgi:two-component system chemotaxis sensor kinase CheA